AMDRNTQLAYAAGFLDGEGCFSIIHEKKMNSFLPRIQVVNTDIKPLRKLVGLFGGSLVQTKMASNGRKIPFHYTASGSNAKSILVSTYGYLIEKRQQVVVLLQLQGDIEKWNTMSRKRGNLPEDVLEYRRWLKQASHEL